MQTSEDSQSEMVAASYSESRAQSNYTESEMMVASSYQGSAMKTQKSLPGTVILLSS